MCAKYVALAAVLVTMVLAASDDEIRQIVNEVSSEHDDVAITPTEFNWLVATKQVEICKLR